MKKLLFALVAGIVICTAGFTGYKVYNNHQMSKFSLLMLENLDLLTQQQEPDIDKEYEDYYNVGRYEVTRSGNGNGSITVIPEPEDIPKGEMKIDITSDVVLVTYINDCKWHSSRTCYQAMRTIRVLFTRN